MVVCVVVNWNGWRDTLACLQTLACQTAQPLHVVVVDNGSTDDSVQQLHAWMGEKRSCPTSFALLTSDTNLGFARGANLGIQRAFVMGVEFVWLLNNDTECPPDTLGKLLRTAEQQPEAGLIGSVLYYHDRPTVVQAWGGGSVSRWSGIGSHYVRSTPLGPSSYVTFASVLVRRPVLEQLGLLYDRYFMYYDDSDYCFRLLQTRWRLAVAADTAVLHKESASTERARDTFMEKTVATSGALFLRRHSPMPAASIALFILIKLLNRARRGEWAACSAVLDGWAESRQR